MKESPVLVIHESLFSVRDLEEGIVDVIRWDEKAGLRRDAVRSQGIDVLESTDQSKETGNEEG